MWATAFYSGLRLGELRGLKWKDVDLAENEIRVEASYCNRTNQLVAPKSDKGRRTVPIPAEALRTVLLRYRMKSTDTSGEAYVFGITATRPFDPSTLSKRAKRAWKVAKLNPITPHEPRHTYASLMIAAGVNAKTLSELMGHSSITVTLDRYGHLFSGARDEAAGLLDKLLKRAAESGQAV